MSSGLPEEQDRSDMLRLAEGHDAALNDLMERHSQRLFHYLVRELQSEAEAADLAEEAFVRVYQNRQRFDHARKFSTWLYAIATNLVRDRYRWRTRHPEVSLDVPLDHQRTEWLDQMPDAQPTPGETLELAERAAAVRRAVAELPEDLRTPLILSEYEGLSHAEIGQVLSCSPKAVEMRVYRARHQLRGQLSDLLAKKI